MWGKKYKSVIFFYYWILKILFDGSVPYFSFDLAFSFSNDTFFFLDSKFKGCMWNKILSFKLWLTIFTSSILEKLLINILTSTSVGASEIKKKLALGCCTLFVEKVFRANFLAQKVLYFLQKNPHHSWFRKTILLDWGIIRGKELIFFSPPDFFLSTISQA